MTDSNTPEKRWINNLPKGTLTPVWNEYMTARLLENLSRGGSSSDYDIRSNQKLMEMIRTIVGQNSGDVSENIILARQTALQQFVTEEGNKLADGKGDEPLAVTRPDVPDHKPQPRRR